MSQCCQESLEFYVFSCPGLTSVCFRCRIFCQFRSSLQISRLLFPFLLLFMGILVFCLCHYGVCHIFCAHAVVSLISCVYHRLSLILIEGYLSPLLRICKSF